MARITTKTFAFCCVILYLDSTISGVFGQLDENDDSSLIWLGGLANRYGNEINNKVLENTIQRHQLQQIYLETNPTTNRVDGTSLLNDKVQKLSSLLQEANAKVQVLTEKAEATFQKHNDSSQLTNDDVRFYSDERNVTDLAPQANRSTLLYFNAKCHCGEQMPAGYDNHDCVLPFGGLAPSDRYQGNDVSFTTSAVQIPLDVYNEGPEVLSDIQWTQTLDESFRDQSCVNMTSRTRWSYVATDNGVYRYFPARQWNVGCSKIDIYDARDQPWFVQSVSSPKDILIMIDTSGSVVGLTLNLIRHSVRHLMDTLTENDYFNVFVFNEKAEFVNPTCPGLIQAVPMFKEMAHSWLEEITVGNASSFEVGFDFAFRHLNVTTSNTSRDLRASCNPIILLLTDGGAPYPENTFRKWNLQKQTRVFTYSVGKHFASTSTLKDMACNNRGKFDTIPSNSATHLVTKDYLGKISRGIAYSGRKSSKWSLPYEDHLGLGTVLSITRPIYQSSDDLQVGQKVKAVVGCDIMYRDVREAIEPAEISANAFAFGIENNGFAFYHPNLKQGRLGNPITTDIDDLEVHDVSKIRRSMIERENGETDLSAVFISNDGKHLSRAQYKYIYAPVQESLFSVSLALPTSNLNQLVASPPTSITLTDININKTNVVSYVSGLRCVPRVQSVTSSCQSDSVAPPSSVNASIQMVADGTACGAGKVDPSQTDVILLHGWVSKELLGRHWSMGVTHNAVRSMFVTSDSSPSVMRIQHQQLDEMSKKIESILSNPTQQDYFKRPLLSNATIYSVVKVGVTSPAVEEATNVTQQNMTTSAMTSDATAVTPTLGGEVAPTEQAISLIVASQPVTVATDPYVTTAVVGAVLDADVMAAIFFNMSVTQPCEDDCPKPNCWIQDSLCLILDDGGILITTNQDWQQNKVGEFYGSIDRDLMEALERDGVYVTSHVFDHQVVCNRSDVTDSAATRSYVIPTLTGLFQAGRLLLTSSLVALHNAFLLSLATLRSVLASADPIWTYDFSFSEVTSSNYKYEKKHCVYRRTVYEFGNVSDVTQGTASCTSICNRTYVATRIPDSNLLMIVADASGPCSVDRNFCFRPIVTLETEVSRDVQCPSDRFRRKPSDECFDAASYPAELDVDCGAHQLTQSTSAFILSVLTFLITQHIMAR
uniref:Voltage-dependent calcium channel subunit alpha-2/delta-1 n=1 Tax=Phallusia mammillata TaxID=59560 RepID=A0A6F9D8R9_9ASCI|nr:voltage-dependent calcium channel subunit alpha-2/delta-1 [Phallusia mammillata]